MEWAVRIQKWTLTAMSLYTLTDLWVSPRSGWFSSTCRSSSWSIPAYFSRRRNGLLRPVVRTRRPGLAAPWDSINSFSSVLRRPQTKLSTEKWINSVANKLTSIHLQDYIQDFIKEKDKILVHNHNYRVLLHILQLATIISFSFHKNSPGSNTIIVYNMDFIMLYGNM